MSQSVGHVGLNPTQQQALGFARATKAMIEGDRFVPGYYHDSVYYSGTAREERFFWMGYCIGCHCGGGGNEKVWLVVAAIVAAFASIVTLLHSFVSAGMASRYGDQAELARSNEATLQQPADLKSKELYRYSKIIMTNARAERAVTSLSQLAMATGLGMLTVAFIIAYGVRGHYPILTSLFISGGGLTGGGLLLYGFNQLHYTAVREPKIRNAYDRMNQLIQEFDAIQYNKPTYNLLYFSITTHTLTYVTITQKVPVTRQPAVSVASGVVGGVQVVQPSSLPTPDAPPPAYDDDAVLTDMGQVEGGA